MNQNIVGASLVILILLLAYGVYETPENDRKTYDRHDINVSSVTDGDTIDIRFANNTNDTVRLLGVDTPEKHVQSTEEYPGVPNNGIGKACLLRWGKAATNFTRTQLYRKKVTLELGRSEQTRGDYGRLLGVVYIGNKSLNYRLVKQGYARVYRSDFSGISRYLKAEKQAKNKNLGLWRCAMAVEKGIVVSDTNFDVLGPESENLEGEWIEITNHGKTDVGLGGWRVEDEHGHNHSFSDRSLGSGSSLKLRTGSGLDNSSSVFWNRTSAVWNNGGDTVYIYDRNSSLVDKARSVG